jgi:hypothetical protein
MGDLSLRFEFEPGTNLDAAARSIRERLAALDTVAAVDVRPENARITGLEIVGAIAVAVEIVRGTRKFVAQVRRLMTELKEMRNDIGGLRTIALDGNPKPIMIDHVTDNDIAQLTDERDGTPH